MCLRVSRLPDGRRRTWLGSGMPETVAPGAAVAVAEVDVVGQLEQIQAMAPEGNAQVRQAFAEKGHNVLEKREAIGLEHVLD
ncbi:hypothetical protein PBY51_021508 [Eleginops maclovinus]|uniref:Uncharacterized protein n=1 Tax=Eleginops maclovinus TaxID=56733 RepID=A0AAN7XET0_ELEMC|nr:hypothetical protein PBY51_021508 [Eleginops maclovinus]